MSKKYDVYGVGNALVDIEYEVSRELLLKSFEWSIQLQGVSR